MEDRLAAGLLFLLLPVRTSKGLPQASDSCHCYFPYRLSLFHCSMAFTSRAQESFPVFSMTFDKVFLSHWVPNM